MDNMIGEVTVERPAVEDWYQRKGGWLPLNNKMGMLEVYVTVISVSDHPIWDQPTQQLVDFGPSAREETERKFIPNWMPMKSELLAVEIIASEGYTSRIKEKVRPFVEVAFPIHPRTMFPNKQRTESVLSSAAPEWRRTLFFLALNTHPQEMMVRVMSVGSKGLMGSGTSATEHSSTKVILKDDFNVHRAKYKLAPTTNNSGWIELCYRRLPCAAFFPSNDLPLR
jgi:hypothetical protein